MAEASSAAGKRLTFAVIGFGGMGKVHARNILAHPNARLKYVVDPVTTALDDEFAAAAIVDEAAVLADAEVDVIVIASPSDTHAGLVERAAQAGKAAFCEKPIDLSADRVKGVLEAVNRAGTPLFITFNRRFDPSFRALHDRLRAGEIGAPQLIILTSRDPYPRPIEFVPSSGGLFRDMMVHDFDIARWLLGEEPVTVQAVGSCLNDPRVAELGSLDTAAVTLRTASGQICVINCVNNASYGYDQRVEVHGERGMLQLGNRPPDSVLVSNADGVRAAPPSDFYMARYAEAYRRELDAFVGMMLAGDPVSPNGVDGLRALQLADCAELSYRSGSSVTVPL